MPSPKIPNKFCGATLPAAPDPVAPAVEAVDDPIKKDALVVVTDVEAAPVVNADVAVLLLEPVTAAAPLALGTAVSLHASAAFITELPYELQMA